MAAEPENEKDYPVLLGRSFRDDENPIHVLRYEFKPASADDTQIGLLTISSSDKATVDIPNRTENGKPISFTGNYEEGRDIECLLVYDSEAHAFRLERISGTVRNLRHDRRGGDLAAQRLADLPPNISLESSLNDQSRSSVDVKRRSSIPAHLPVDSGQDASAMRKSVDESFAEAFSDFSSESDDAEAIASGKESLEGSDDSFSDAD